MKTILTQIRLTLFTVLCFAATARAAPELSELKLQGRWPAGVNASGFSQGASVALSEKWALSSAAFANIGFTQEGAVQVFNAVTGAWVRLLRLPAPAAANVYFGYSMAISGDLAVISAHGLNASQGAVFVFNLATGVLVRKIVATGGAAGDNFGRSVALSGGKLVIGAWGTSGNTGCAYVFDLATGLQLAKLTPSDNQAAELFGFTVAAEGNIVLVGATNRSAQRGAAYAYDLTTFAELAIVVPAASVAGDKVGTCIALHHGIAIMAAPFQGATKGAVFTHDLRSGTEHTLTASDGVAGDLLGFNFANALAADNGIVLAGATGFGNAGDHAAVYAFDLRTGLPLGKIQPTDNSSSNYFAGAIAMKGNNAIVGCSGDNSPLASIGSAYLFKPVTTVLPMTKVAARGDSAPSAPEAAFYVTGDAFINNQSEVAFGAKLSGAGSHANTDTGAWTTMRAGGALSLSKMSYNGLGLGTVLTVGTPIVNQPGTALYQVTYKVGTGGITTLNNKGILAEIGTFGAGLIQTGDAVAPFGTAKLLNFTELVQTMDATPGHDRWAVTCTLRPEVATSTTAVNDSGVYIHNMNGATDGLREGQGVPPAAVVNYGQFTGRVAYMFESLAFSAATTAPVANNAVIMQKFTGFTEVEVARKGLPAPVLGGPLFSAFIGETVDGLERVVYRATVAGAGVTSANNEGLWGRTKAGVHAMVLRKGVNTTLPAGLTIAKIIQFWGVYGNDSQVMALVQLGGVGVSSANDQALILVQEDASLTILMREGQPAQGCHPATIGVISRVEVDPWNGVYAVITTLAGAPVGTELALFTGTSIIADTTTHVTLRRPMLYLRKGALYDNQPSKIKSLSLPATNITASGAGGTGRGRAISWDGDFAITIEFDNLVRQIMKGQL